jgi:hypothetical protein
VIRPWAGFQPPGETAPPRGGADGFQAARGPGVHGYPKLCGLYRAAQAEAPEAGRASEGHWIGPGLAV